MYYRRGQDLFLCKNVLSLLLTINLIEIFEVKNIMDRELYQAPEATVFEVKFEDNILSGTNANKNGYGGVTEEYWP